VKYHFWKFQRFWRHYRAEFSSIQIKGEHILEAINCINRVTAATGLLLKVRKLLDSTTIKITYDEEIDTEGVLVDACENDLLDELDNVDGYRFGVAMLRRTTLSPDDEHQYN
jgi:hypothetical protein